MFYFPFFLLFPPLDVDLGLGDFQTYFVFLLGFYFYFYFLFDYVLEGVFFDLDGVFFDFYFGFTDQSLSSSGYSSGYDYSFFTFFFPIILSFLIILYHKYRYLYLNLKYNLNLITYIVKLLNSRVYSQKISAIQERAKHTYIAFTYFQSDSNLIKYTQIKLNQLLYFIYIFSYNKLFLKELINNYKPQRIMLKKDPYLNSTFKSDVAPKANNSYSNLEIPKSKQAQRYSYNQYSHHNYTPISQLGHNYKHGNSTKYLNVPTAKFREGMQYKIDNVRTNQAMGPSISQIHNDPIREYENKKKDGQFRFQLDRAQNQFRRMARAYSQQNKLNQKILNYQAANNEYHQALKMRNLDLNNKLTEAATHTQLLYNRFQTDAMRNHHDKDLLLRKYESQADQLLEARKTINNLLELKTRLEEELAQMVFTLEKQSERFGLEIKEHSIRMQGLERTMKNVTETKDKEIMQLRHKLQIYEDENKRLTEQNRSLYFTQQNSTNPNQNPQKPHGVHPHGPHSHNKQNRAGIQNLSQINYTNMDSNHKLQEQKLINDKLQRQIDELKKMLFRNEQGEQFGRFQRELEGGGKGGQAGKDGKGGKGGINTGDDQRFGYGYGTDDGRFGNATVNMNKNKGNQNQLNPNTKNNDHQIPTDPQLEGIMNSINTLRSAINKQVFDMFYKSVKDGEKHRSNSLVIFMQNWKNFDLGRVQPYIKSYMQSRNSIKQLCQTGRYTNTPLSRKIQQCLPYRLNTKSRSEVNLWILSTIQLAKNQKEASKNSENNLILFLFRLLTIQYRIAYPMQGKSYAVDQDVKNQLHHEICKAVQAVLQLK